MAPNKCKSCSSIHERTLIESVAEHPILFVNRKRLPSMSRFQYTMASANAWREVSLRTNLSVNRCQRKFTDLKYRYIVIRNMIRSGELTEEFVRSNTKAARFWDGTFKFLDPHVCDIPIRALPECIKKFYITMSVAKSKEKSRGTLKIENKVIKNTFIEMTIFPQETNTQPACILPTDEYDDSENIVNEMIFDSTIKNNTTVQETEEFILSDLNAPVDDDIVTGITPDPIQIFLTKYSDNNDDGFDIKQYFNELAELLCARLVLGKRQNFLNHVDSLVSEILEG